MDESKGHSVESSWQKLCQSVKQSALQANRRFEEIKIIVVSKTVEEVRILEAWKAGASEFGENRVQELLAKKKNLPETFHWHLIGSLQTNKVKQVIGQVSLIHSLDRVELAAAIDEQAAKMNLKKVPCLIQVNTARETSKSGFKVEDVEAFAASLNSDTRISIQGLMAIGPHTNDTLAIRKVFRETRELRDQLAKKFPEHAWKELSMGMSGDYQIAIEEGSTMIRVGTAIFGERNL